MTVVVISENGQKAMALCMGTVGATFCSLVAGHTGTCLPRPGAMRPHVEGTPDPGGVFGIDGPDVCRDRCALAGTEHTEDQCAGVAR